MNRKLFAKTRSRKIADTTKTAAATMGLFRLFKNIVGFVLISGLMLLLMSRGIPTWFCLLIITIMVALIVTEIIGLRRNVRVNLDELYEPEPEEIVLESGEDAVLWIPGVMRTWKTRGASVLGTGKVINPENTLLISNKGVWAMTVPIPGADKIVSDTDIGKWQFLTSWRDIENKLYEMLSSGSLEKTLRECRAKRICLYSQIKSYKFSDLTQGINLKVQGNETRTKSFSYSIRDKDMFFKTREIVKSYVDK